MLESKVCKDYGRIFENLRNSNSRGIWAQVLYCSKRCRHSGSLKVLSAEPTECIE